MRPALRKDSRPPDRDGRAWAVRALGYAVVWALVAVPASVVIFLGSSQTTAIASHDAVVSPTLDGYAALDLGPYLPDVRYPSGSRIGAHIDLGETDLTSYEALFQRYAFIGSRPEGQIAKLRALQPLIVIDAAIHQRRCDRLAIRAFEAAL